MVVTPCVIHAANTLLARLTLQPLPLHHWMRARARISVHTLAFGCTPHGWCHPYGAATCGRTLPKAEFSNAQWKKGERGKCKACVEAGNSTPATARKAAPVVPATAPVVPAAAPVDATTEAAAAAAEKKASVSREVAAAAAAQEKEAAEKEAATAAKVRT